MHGFILEPFKARIIQSCETPTNTIHLCQSRLG